MAKAKPVFRWKEDDPLARCEGETLNAWAALNDYARMGSGRSLRKLHADYRGQIKGGSRVPCSTLATLEAWSVEHAWQSRVESFDVAQSARQQSKYEDWIDAELERRQRMVEQAHDLFPELVANARKTKVEPRDIAAFMRALSEVSRQAAGDDAQRVELTGAGGGAVAVKDESGLSERAARALELFVQAREAAKREQSSDSAEDRD